MFKTSLQVMMEKMTASDPVFIRCIKPNTDKRPGVFVDDFVQAQVSSNLPADPGT